MQVSVVRVPLANDPQTRTQELQQKLQAAAKKSASRRFHALYDKLWLGYILQTAWQRVRANGGAPGVDGVTIRSLEQSGVAELLTEIATELRARTYCPQPVLRVHIPKPDGRLRPLGIPTVKDRVVQTAALLVLEPIFEADFSDASCGFRPGRGQVDALRKVEQELWNCWAVADADIEGYFDNVDHRRLKQLLRGRISDRRMLRLINQWLKCGAVDKDGTRRRTPKGVPQGGVISPLLANIYLNYLDQHWEHRHRCHGELVRYADDFVIVCRTPLGARKALETASQLLRQLGLQLNPKKTRVVELVNGKEGFDFLGIHHRKVRQVKNPKYFHPTSWPSANTMKKARATVREKVRGTPFRDEAYADLLMDLRGYLGGWANYFKHSREARQKFIRLDYDVRAELMRWHKRRYRGRRTAAVMQEVITHLHQLPRMVVPNNWCQRQQPTAAAAR